ncbi:MAG: hypothetical protein D6808_08220 [Candidatus Dadabacteria bacterium]|nr:MAG: hypothetical protein D6808_08220 [Candidatus Dadabacteria bacterium]
MVSKNPTVYSFDLPNLNGHIFLTELNKCGRTHTSPASALRQLFVEIDTKIIDKRPVGSKENSFRYLAESSIDGSKIWIAAYTTIKGNCLRDFIFWGKASEIPLASFKEQLHSFEEIITSLSGEKTL